MPDVHYKGEQLLGCRAHGKRRYDAGIQGCVNLNLNPENLNLNLDNLDLNLEQLQKFSACLAGSWVEEESGAINHNPKP